MNGLTCAHRSLPLGSLVRVTNLTNHKSVVLRVNDRGPLPGNRIIDLSYAAARFLGFSGTAKVRIDLVDSTAQLAQVLFPMSPALQN
jgi:rare lipoprotein A